LALSFAKKGEEWRICYFFGESIASSASGVQPVFRPVETTSRAVPQPLPPLPVMGRQAVHDIELFSSGQ